MGVCQCRCALCNQITLLRSELLMQPQEEVDKSVGEACSRIKVCRRGVYPIINHVA